MPTRKLCSVLHHGENSFPRLSLSAEVIFFLKNVKHLSSGDDDDDDGEGDGGDKEPEEPGCFDYFMHVLAVPWKLIFSTIPPTGSDSIE